MTVIWRTLDRPGYFGRQRDEKVATLNREHGEGNWRLVWIMGGTAFDFLTACSYLYEASFFVYLKDRREDLRFICAHRDVIDNAPTNIDSGCDYLKQEAYSTHIQDIAIRNVVRRLGRCFSHAPESSTLVVRGADSHGYRFGPGNIPFFAPSLIHLPSQRPQWANPESVEDFWQSNKWVQVKQ